MNLQQAQSGGAFGLLREFAQRRRNLERCELCSEELAGPHPHLVDTHARKILCSCNACAILFNGMDGKYKRVPDRVLALSNFQLSDAQWDELRVPINLAFFFRSTREGRVVALYPSPAGPIESLLPLEAWSLIEAQNPILTGMEADVEALLVNRISSDIPSNPDSNLPGEYLLPIDECYKLVGLVRAHWRGFSGGSEVWEKFRDFIEDLKIRAVQTSQEIHA